MSERSPGALLADCAQCGLCREVCIVERLGAHSVTSFLCGDEDFSSWLCSSCWHCQEICPQGIDIHTIMMERRRQEEPPSGHEASFRSVLQSGYALPMGQETNELRKIHGLDEVKFIPVKWLGILLQRQEDRE